MRELEEKDGIKVSGSFRGNCEIKNIWEREEVWRREIHLQLLEDWTGPDSKVLVEFSFPAVDISGRWFPVCGFDRSIKGDYDAETLSMTARSAPVVCFFNSAGENRHTIALSEVRQRVSMRCGIHEEDGTMLCRMEVPVTGRSGENDCLIIRESCAREPFWKTLAGVASWWEQILSFVPMEVPKEGRMPLYSFWYSMHQNVTAEKVEQESRLAGEMGLRSIILDDGWQTGDNNRGYAFCGDWEPCREKFPDFAAHVEHVHKMGLKYLLWLSVPYIGKKTKIWEKFQDKLLRYDEGQQAGILDLRYPEVRGYLKNIYLKAVRDWKLDGLKLDFIDEFYVREDTPKYREGMDIEDIQDALNVLLSEVTEELKEIRPDILIEFRQKYIGPQIRRYGNLFRVSDCPGSAISNRVGTIDLRLLSGNTAVHSDMLMWHPEEEPEEAALQMIACLFSTVQISVNLKEQSAKMREMLLFWTTFMRDNVELLQKSQIEPSEPENLYPEVQAQHGNTRVIVHYGQRRVADIRNLSGTLYYIHGTKEEEVCFRKEKDLEVTYRILDCCGRQIDEGKHKAGEWETLTVPTGGMVIFS